MSDTKLTDTIRAGFLRAEEITKEHARTFHFASRFLPAEKRRAAYAVYALCRISDETVDSNALNTNDSRESLARLRSRIHAVYSEEPQREPLLLAFHQTVRRYGIPVEYFDGLMDGMEMDLSKTRYEDFNELYDYCYKVAGIVGLIMLKIFGSAGNSANTHAVELGVAMQLTNITRDVKEDYGRGRIYLPQDELRACGVDSLQLERGTVNEGMKELIRTQIKRAREYYRRAARGMPLITDARCRFVVRLMHELYAGICDEIERNNLDVFSRRAHVNSIRKLMRTLKIIAGKDSP